MRPSNPAPTTPPTPTEVRLAEVLAELRRVRDLLESTQKPLLTIEEIARLTGRAAFTVRRWVKVRSARRDPRSGHRPARPPPRCPRGGGPAGGRGSGTAVVRPDTGRSQLIRSLSTADP